MITNEKKKLSPLEAVDLPAGACRAGFRIKAVIQGRPAAVPRAPLASTSSAPEPGLRWV